MSTYQHQAEQLMNSLGLPQQPIAITFCNELPNEIANFDGVVPAGCSFWQHAATKTFATSASDHELCSIGVHTHNLSGATAAQPTELKTTLEAMIGLDYVRESEISAIPVVAGQHKYVIYGPLSESKVEPDAVLLFAQAQQGLILTESITRVDGDMPAAMGRPACAVIPQVMNLEKAAMSLGCCGARAYLDALNDSIALWALPGKKLSAYCDQIEILANANKTLTMFHAQRSADIAAGLRPAVQESLAKLG
ncbi:MAG: hypothetical protein ACI9KN_000649 [Gammaproteobacteria bacterium]|jgi:uncharacterized protein (DUF169 family)